MPTRGAAGALARTVGTPQAAAALLAVGGLLALVLPLPALAVDVLLALSLGAAVGVLLVTLMAPEPDRLSSLPPVLVLGSLARILLCLCVSRLVLVTGEGAPLVTTLGRTISGGDAIAGLGLLVVLAVVHLAMVTAGVGRMSEVAARFALDAMPGKQMGLDAALARGHLSAGEAREQVRRLEQEAGFYGAMDGAGRLLRGEAVAAVVIVALTAVGAAARSLSAGGEAAEIAAQYSLTATGHGLVTILPALLMGAAAAVAVSRAASGSGLIEEIGGQMVQGPWPAAAAAVALLGLGLLPGVAKAPTLVVGAGLAALAWWLGSRRGATVRTVVNGGPGFEPSGDEMLAEVGMGLVDLIEDSDGLGEVLVRVREEMGAALGFAPPPLLLRDSMALRPTEYCVSFRARTLARGIVRPRRLLAVPPAAGVTPDVGRPGEVGDGRSGVWVTDEEARSLAEIDYLCLRPAEAIARHMRVALRRHAAAMFDLEAASRLLRRVDGTHSEAVALARQAGVTAPVVRQVGARLLEAGLPLRDPLALVETLAEALPETHDPEQLALRCRPHAAAAACRMLAPDGVLIALDLAPELQDELAEAAHGSGERTVAALAPERARCWTAALHELGREHGWGRPMPLLCEQRALLPLLDLCRQVTAELIALTPSDLPPDITVEFAARLDPESLQQVPGTEVASAPA